MQAKVIKNVLKKCAIVITILFVLLFCCYLLLISPTVQTFLAKKATHWLSEKTGTKVEVKAVKISFFNSLLLSGLYIEDQKKDTLLYVNKLWLNFNYNNETKSIVFYNMQADNAFLHIKQFDKQQFNFTFLLDSLLQKKQTKTTKHYIFKYKDISLKNSRLYYDYANKPKIDSIIDFNHIRLYNTNLSVQNFAIHHKDSVSFHLEKLDFLTQKGFQLITMQANVGISPKNIKFDSLEIVTPQTHLAGNYEMLTKSYDDYNDFLDKVKIKSNFNASQIGLSDIGYFTPIFYRLYRSVKFSGKIKGTIADLRASDLNIAFKHGTHFKGDATFHGLPDMDNTFIHFKVKNLTTSKKMLENLPILNNGKLLSMKLPQNFSALKTIYFHGNLAGFVNDFVAYGDFKTALGNAHTDLALKNLTSEKAPITYSGKITSTNFDLGKFIDNDKVGKIALNAQIKGSGIDLKNIVAKIDGEADFIDYLGYRYKNITTSGTFRHQKFKGNLSVNDNNIAFDFDGAADFSSKLPQLSFQADIKRAKLKKLHLLPQADSNAVFSAKINVNLSGNNINKMDGTAQIKNAKYVDNGKTYDIKNATFKSGTQNGKQFISLKSDLLNASVEGNYDLTALPANFKHILHKYLPEAITTPFKQNFTDANAQFNFDCQLKNTELLSKLFFSKLKLSDNTAFSGTFDAPKQLLSISGIAPTIQYQNMKMDYGTFIVKTIDSTLYFNLGSYKLSFGDSLPLANFNINATLQDDSLKTNLNWDDYKPNGNNANINFLSKIGDSWHFMGKIKNAYIVANGKKWQANDDNFIKTDSSYVAINNLKIKSKTASFIADGILSAKDADKMNIKIENFNLDNLNPVLSNYNTKLKGIVNGKMAIRHFFNQPLFTTDLHLDSLRLNGNLIGSGPVSCAYVVAENKAFLYGNIKQGNLPLFSFSGDYYIQKNNNHMHIVFLLNRTPLNLAGNYLKDYITQIQGTTSGKIVLIGNFKKPTLSGILTLEDAAFHVNYLNTDYHIEKDTKVDIAPGFFGIDNLNLADKNDNIAYANVTVYHHYFKNLNYNIGIDTRGNGFTFLNTNDTDNSSYYGKAVLSGIGNISGYGNQTLIDAHLTSQEGTILNIPLSDETQITNNNFVQFTKDTTLKNLMAQIENKKTNLANIKMDFDLEVNPNAKIKLIFDKSAGDILKTTGSGRINLKISNQGEFKMFGKYTIQNGDYLFTLKKLINKRFSIDNGSTIDWTGNPYEATMNVYASYNIRTSLQDILNDPTQQYNKRVPVVVQMHMYNKLMHPDIDFDIKLPSVDDNTRERVNSVLFVNDNSVNKAEMNRQVFALLVLRRFLPPAGTDPSNNPEHAGFGAETSSELLSNQLSNWLSNISNKFDVGFKYRPGENKLTKDEMELGLSTRLFNNRVIVDGNVGYMNSNELNDENNDFIGEFNVEYLVTKDGHIRITAFNRSNNDYLLENNSKYTQGVGLYYRVSFDRLKELFERKKKRKSTEKKGK